ncbi:14962_t:CDS:2, partial [Gigaspora margarita]
VGDYVLPVPNDKALDTALSKETCISSNDSIQIYVLAKKEYEYPIFLRGLLDYFVKDKELRYDQHLKDEIPKSIFEELMDYYLIDIKERHLKMVGNTIRRFIDLICIEYFDPNKATLTDFEEQCTGYNIISNPELYEIIKLMSVVNRFLNSDKSSY